MSKQITDPFTIICFNCEAVEKKDWGHYYEFRDASTLEQPECPECGSCEFTLPKFYIEEMSISRLAEYFDRYAKDTGLIPLVDLKIMDFKLPHAITIAGYKAV